MICPVCKEDKNQLFYREDGTDGVCSLCMHPDDVVVDSHSAERARIAELEAQLVAAQVEVREWKLITESAEFKLAAVTKERDYGKKVCNAFLVRYPNARTDWPALDWLLKQLDGKREVE